MTAQRVRCAACDVALQESPGINPANRQPCPSCGSVARRFEVVLASEISFRTMLAFKARHASGGRPFSEGKVGDSLHRKTGRWMRLERIIDRAKNWYREVISDRANGQVVHACEEPLTHHQGHGSAKIPSANARAPENNCSLPRS